jgi:hypothetical protein
MLAIVYFAVVVPFLVADKGRIFIVYSPYHPFSIYDFFISAIFKDVLSSRTERTFI